MSAFLRIPEVYTRLLIVRQTYHTFTIKASQEKAKRCNPATQKKTDFGAVQSVSKVYIEPGEKKRFKKRRRGVTSPMAKIEPRN